MALEDEELVIDNAIISVGLHLFLELLDESKYPDSLQRELRIRIRKIISRHDNSINQSEGI